MTSESSQIAEQPEDVSQDIQPLLLSLPAEIRHKIWKTVLRTSPMLILIKSYNPEQDMQVRSLSWHPFPDSTAFAAGACDGPQPHDLTPHRGNDPAMVQTADTPFDWMRTNRQIYAEAQTAARKNVDVHVCAAQAMACLIQRSPETLLSSSSIRSLSLCLKVTINTDRLDGYDFATEPTHGWELGHMGGQYCCSVCFALHTTTRGDRVEDFFPSLSKLSLKLFFTCARMQGNWRPVIGTLPNGRAQYGSLHRPEKPKPLICMDSEARVEGFVERFCGLRPLNMFCGRKLEEVDVRFVGERAIKHNVQNVPDNYPEDRCWCVGRQVDGSDLFAVGVVEKIRKRMVAGV